jgi:mono/diheme cytochrome c family protein
MRTWLSGAAAPAFLIALASIGAPIAPAAIAPAAIAQAAATDGDIKAGRQLAVTTCAACHRVTAERDAPRPVAGAPDFAAIANTPAITPTSVFVFLHTPHPNMPNLILTDTESGDVIAYIFSLRKPAPQ